MKLRQPKRFTIFLLSGIMILMLYHCRPTTEKENIPETDETTADVEMEPDSNKNIIKEVNAEATTVVAAKAETKRDTEDPDPDINAFVALQKDPTPLNLDAIKNQIGYPQIAKDAGIEGTVVVRILIDKNGDYRDHRILKQVHPILSKAVEEQLKQLRFTPGIQAGKPIKAWINLPFQFRLLN
jgi:protein TonB